MFLSINCQTQIALWAGCWGVNGLDGRVQIQISPRLKRPLANSVPSKALIRLRPDVVMGSNECLLEVLCHELAHIAVFELFGPAAKPHGPEWRSLVAAVGFAPQTSTEIANSARANEHKVRRSDALYLHRCPVCQNTRRAKRPITQWRCAPCKVAGLDGQMTITRMLESPEPGKK
jgi:predicted SprT family Zn-dependent metalloprotease